MSRAWLVALFCLAGCSDVGDACESDDDCSGALVCYRGDDAAAEGVCGHPLRAAGETCATTAECDDGLFCSNDLPADIKQRYGECVPVLPAGQPCYRDANCQFGLVCGVPEGDETGFCEMPQ